MLTRRIAVGTALIAITMGLSVIPSAAQHAGTASILNVGVTIPIRRLPVINEFYPPHKFGDRDFAGHGPQIVATASLDGVGTSRNLTVTLCMTATETEDDFTKVEGCTTYLLYQAPRLQCIATVSHGTVDEVRYTDSDHDLEEFPRFDSLNFVQKWWIMGDTVGDEAGDRTAVHIETFPLTVTTGSGGCT